MQVPFVCFVPPSVNYLVQPNSSARRLHIMIKPLRQGFKGALWLRSTAFEERFA
jgi:hypothetical protein